MTRFDVSQTSRIYRHKAQIQYPTIHDILLYSAPLGSYIMSNICSLENLVTQISWWPLSVQPSHEERAAAHAACIH